MFTDSISRRPVKRFEQGKKQSVSSRERDDLMNSGSGRAGLEEGDVTRPHRDATGRRCW